MFKNLQIKTNEKGYIQEFVMPNSEGKLEGGFEVDFFEIDIEDFKQNFQAYKHEGGKLIRDEEILSTVQEENQAEELRYRRTRECFSFINRGWLWYSTLTTSQLSELTKWYKDWLDVTKTKKVPKKPSWLD